MAYVYLLDLYKYIEERIGAASAGLDRAGGDVTARRFEQGRIDALKDFQAFLQANFNPKLPKRIREAYFGKKN